MLFGLFLTLGVAVLSVALRSFQNSYCAKSGRARHSGCHRFSRFILLPAAGSWVLAAAVSWLFLPWLEILTRIRALRLAEGKTASAEKPAVFGYFPSAERHHARNRERRLRARERRRMGLGGLPPVFPAVLQRGRPSAGHHLPERAA